MKLSEGVKMNKIYHYFIGLLTLFVGLTFLFHEILYPTNGKSGFSVFFALPIFVGILSLFRAKYDLNGNIFKTWQRFFEFGIVGRTIMILETIFLVYAIGMISIFVYFTFTARG